MMLNLQVLVVCCLLVASAVGATLDPRWKLLFSDEFEQNTLDTTKWTARAQPGFNDEKEYYHPSHVSVKNGAMVIKSDINNTFSAGYKYTSGYVDTATKFSATFGRYEVRAKLPQAKGIWPAHWMLSDAICWPVGAEIDIMESISVGGQIHATYHFATVCGKDDGNGTTYDTKLSLAADYHVYAIEWEPDRITWFFDDKVIKTIVNTSVAHGKPFAMDGSPHYIILNTAVGGSWPGSPDNTTVFPQYHYIDYVRAYGWEPCKTGCVHGCCDVATETCTCDFGFYGTLCEYAFNNVSSFVNNFVTKQDYDSVTGNAEINNGLTLTVQGDPLSGGEWKSKTPFAYGNFTFTLKGNKVSGTGLLLLGTSSTGGYQGFQLGVIQNAITFQTWGAKPFGWTSYNTGFDTTLAYHTYTVSYTTVFKVYVDGKLIVTTNWAPSTALQMFVQYQYSTQYFGSWTSTPPVSVSIQSLSWTQYVGDKAICLAPASTSSASATTGIAQTTTSKSSTSGTAQTTTSKTTGTPSPSTTGTAQTTTSKTTGTPAPATSDSASSTTGVNPTVAPGSSTTGSEEVDSMGSALKITLCAVAIVFVNAFL